MSHSPLLHFKTTSPLLPPPRTAKSALRTSRPQSANDDLNSPQAHTSNHNRNPENLSPVSPLGSTISNDRVYSPVTAASTTPPQAKPTPSFLDMDDSPVAVLFSPGSHNVSGGTPRALSASTSSFNSYEHQEESLIDNHASAFMRPLSLSAKGTLDPLVERSGRDSGNYETALLQANRISLEIPNVPSLSAAYSSNAQSISALPSSIASSSRGSSSISIPQSSLLRASMHSTEGTSDSSIGRMSSDSFRRSGHDDESYSSLPFPHDLSKKTSPLRLRKPSSSSRDSDALVELGGLGIDDAAFGLAPAFDMHFTSTHRNSRLDDVTLTRFPSNSSTTSPRRRQSEGPVVESSWRASSTRVGEEGEESQPRPSTSSHVRPPIMHSNTAPLSFPTSRMLEHDRDTGDLNISQSLSGSRSSSYRYTPATDSSTSHTSSIYYSEGGETEWLADEGDDYTRDLLDFGERGTSPSTGDAGSATELENWSRNFGVNLAGQPEDPAPKKMSTQLAIVDRSGQSLEDAVSAPGTTHLLLQRTTDTALLVTYLTLSLPLLASKLVVLDISFCNLVELPSALTSCVRLQELDVSGNPLESASLPAFLSSLSSLRVLIADSCELAFLSPSLVHLRKLHTVSFRDNVLRSLPSFLCRLPNLERLLVDGNAFHWQWANLVQPILTSPSTSRIANKELPPIAAVELPPASVKSLGTRSKSYGDIKASSLLFAVTPLRRASANEEKTRNRSKSVATPFVPPMDLSSNHLIPGWMPQLPLMPTPDIVGAAETVDSPFRKVSFPLIDTVILPPATVALEIPSPSGSSIYSPVISPTDSSFTRSIAIANLGQESSSSRKWGRIFRKKSSTAYAERSKSISDATSVEASKRRGLLSIKSSANSSGASTPVSIKLRPSPIQIEIDTKSVATTVLAQDASAEPSLPLKFDHASGLRSIMAYLRDVDDLSSEPTPAPIVPLRSSMSLATVSTNTSPNKNHLRRTTSPNTTVGHRRQSRRPEASPVKLRSDAVKSERVIREIVATEASYVKSLAELISLYLVPASLGVSSGTVNVSGGRREETVVPLVERRAVFANIGEIHEFHEKSFLPQLQAAALDADNAAGQIARVFIRYAATLQMYSTYVTTFDTALARLLTWTDESRRRPSASSSSGTDAELDSPAVMNTMQRKRVKAFMKRARASLGHSQISLEAYLLLPVQRVPRYRMLLDALVACTAVPTLDGSIQADDAVQRAFKLLSEVATDMNERKRESEGKQQLKVWEKRLGSHFRSPLCQPHRTLIKEGKLTLVRVVKRTSTLVGPQNSLDLSSSSQVYQLHTLHTESNHQTLIALLCSDILVLLKEAVDSNAPMELFTVLRLSSTPDREPPVSVFGPDSLLRLCCDSRAILYAKCSSRSVATAWCHAINSQQVLNNLAV